MIYYSRPRAHIVQYKKNVRARMRMMRKANRARRSWAKWFKKEK